MINKFYILAGFTIGVGVYAAIRTIRNDVRLEETTDKVNNALNRIDTLEFKCKELKKERIDDWVDAASDILEGQQDSIDRLEDEIGKLNLYANGHRYAIDKLTEEVNLYDKWNHYAIDKLTEEVNEIKEILEKTAGVKFTSEEEE